MCHAPGAGRNVHAPTEDKGKPPPRPCQTEFNSSISQRLSMRLCWARFVAASRQFRQRRAVPAQCRRVLRGCHKRRKVVPRPTVSSRAMVRCISDRHASIAARSPKFLRTGSGTCPSAHRKAGRSRARVSPAVRAASPTGPGEPWPFQPGSARHPGESPANARAAVGRSSPRHAPRRIQVLSYGSSMTSHLIEAQNGAEGRCLQHRR